MIPPRTVFAAACGLALEPEIPEPGHNHPDFIPGTPGNLPSVRPGRHRYRRRHHPVSLQSAAAEKNGEPSLVIVAEGHSDVGRLLDVLRFGYARCEHAQLAAQATRQVRRRNTGQAALRLLKAHGGPDLLDEVPDDAGMRKALLLATSDPGAVVRRDRDDNGYESLPHWQMRAVLATIVPWLAGARAEGVTAP